MRTPPYPRSAMCLPNTLQHQKLPSKLTLIRCSTASFDREKIPPTFAPETERERRERWGVEVRVCTRRKHQHAKATELHPKLVDSILSSTAVDIGIRGKNPSGRWAVANLRARARAAASVVEENVDVALPDDGRLGDVGDALKVGDIKPEPKNLDAVLGLQRRRRCLGLMDTIQWRWMWMVVHDTSGRG